MSNANAGWLFYKKYFFHLHNQKKPDEQIAKKTNEEILRTQKYDYTFPQTESYFCLTTTYPGLVIGTGYNHSMKDFNENFDFGFFFDYTTGMPVIPGSSIKGVLRSLFGQNKNDNYKNEKESLIQSGLESIGMGHVKVDKLVDDIFNGINENNKPKPIYQRDKFFDAFVVKIGEALFYDDYITPHNNPLKDPDPNRMIKVAPGVIYKFSFELHDGIVKKEAKLALFKELIKFHGLGAKTNVGYGQFEESESCA